MDFKQLLQKIDSLGGREQLNESKEDYDYYFGKDKKSDGGKERETGTGHMAKKTDKGIQYTKKDLPGQDTSKDADTKAAEKRAKKSKVDEAGIYTAPMGQPPSPPDTAKPGPGTFTVGPFKGLTPEEAMRHPLYKSNPKLKAEVDKAAAVMKGLGGSAPAPAPMESFDFHNLLAKLDYIAEAKKEEMDEEKTEEGNEFSGELEKARATGADEFEVDGKKYPVKESDDEESDAEELEEEQDIYEAHVYHRVKHVDGKSDYQHHKTFKDEEEAQDYAKTWNKKHGDDKKTAVVKVKKIGEEVNKNPYEQLEECYDGAMRQEQESGLSINASNDTRTGNKSLTVTASGESADELAKLLQLSGLAGGGHDSMEPEIEVHDSMDEEYANEPHVEVQGLEPQIQQGTDLNRPKTMHKHSYRQGDNPMAMREARELAELEKQLTEALAEFKIAEAKKGSKPDFLDMDKDGDRKEPMKKALADKKAPPKKKVSETVVAEKAKSQQQQKFMGMVHAMQKGEKVKGASPELKKVAKSMGRKDARDFAQTKHKGLPKKVAESEFKQQLRSLMEADGHQVTEAILEAGWRVFNKKLSEADVSRDVGQSTPDTPLPTVAQAQQQKMAANASLPVVKVKATLNYIRGQHLYIHVMGFPGVDDMEVAVNFKEYDLDKKFEKDPNFTKVMLDINGVRAVAYVPSSSNKNKSMAFGSHDARKFNFQRAVSAPDLNQQ